MSAHQAAPIAVSRVQALLFQAGAMRFALPTKQVLRVWPQCPLKPCALAPPAIVGLLAYQQLWLPVVDICQLLLSRPCAHVVATRLIIVQIVQPEMGAVGAQTRTFALLAERVLEVASLKPAEYVHAPNFADWLGMYRNASMDAPQLVHPELLLPEELTSLYAQHNPGLAQAQTGLKT
jgi:chemotaxis signal transduction protein